MMDKVVNRSAYYHICRVLEKQVCEVANAKYGMDCRSAYAMWDRMQTWCYNWYNPVYPLHGGRGIKVCKEWDENPLAFIRWAIANGWTDERKNYASIWDVIRVNPDRIYSPDNCKIVPASEAAFYNYGLSYNGEWYSMMQMADMVGCPPRVIKLRIRRGWDGKKVIETPYKPNKAKE